MSTELQSAIEQAWEARDSITPANRDVAEPVEACIQLLLSLIHI